MLSFDSFHIFGLFLFLTNQSYVDKIDEYYVNATNICLVFSSLINVIHPVDSSFLPFQLSGICFFEEQLLTFLSSLLFSFSKVSH